MPPASWKSTALLRKSERSVSAPQPFRRSPMRFWQYAGSGRSRATRAMTRTRNRLRVQPTRTCSRTERSASSGRISTQLGEHYSVRWTCWATLTAAKTRPTRRRCGKNWICGSTHSNRYTGGLPGRSHPGGNYHGPLAASNPSFQRNTDRHRPWRAAHLYHQSNRRWQNANDARFRRALYPPEQEGLALHQPENVGGADLQDRKSTRLNSSHLGISY